MGTIIKLALTLSLPLLAASVYAAPPVENPKHNPDIANMRYQARNHKLFFNSDRGDRIADPNALISAKTQQAISRSSNVVPDFTLPVSDQYEYIDGPNGTIYFYSAEYETEEVVVSEYYTYKNIIGYKFVIYDTQFNVLGEINDKVRLDTSNPDNPETGVASMGLTPILTKKFFNSDDKMEVMVYFNMNTPNYSVNCRSVAYQIGGKKDEEGHDIPLCTIPGNLCDVLEASADKWSEDFYLSFASDYTFPVEPGDDSFSAYVNSMGAIIETYKKVTYGSSAPTKVFEFKMRLNDWPGDQESASPLMSRFINGKPYFITNGYTDGLWIFDEPNESGFSDQTWNSDTKFFVDIYQPTSLDNPNLIQHTEIDVVKSSGDNVFATFYFLGSLSYRNDVDFDNCDEPGKANLLIATKDWEGAEMGTTTSFYLHTPDGNMKTIIGQGVDGIVGLGDIKGHEPEYMFIYNDNGNYTFEFLNPYTGNVHHSFSQLLPWNGNMEGLQANVDRVPAGDSYKYCFELRSPGIDAEGNDVMRLAWVNTAGEITEVDEVNMGKNVRMAKVYIDQSVLNPYVFDTSSEREYMLIVKRGNPSSSSIQEEFLVSTAATKEKPVGKIILQVTPREDYGMLAQIAPLNMTTDPLLWVMYYNNETEKYAQDFFRLPLAKFEAGGDGSAQNPFKIATIGDLQCMRDNLAAHYEIVSDIDGEGVDFISLGKPNTPFSGSLVGNGHTISNFTVPGISEPNALFSYTDNASISSITFVNPTVNLSGSSYNALLASHVQRSTISDIHVIGLSVNSPSAGEFGTLVNTASLNTSISGCSVVNASINLPNTDVVGGIVADIRTGATVTSSAFTGTINGKSVVGGILGSASSNAGSVTDCHVDADIAAHNIVGGIVGDMDHRILVDHCYVEGSLTASETFGTMIVDKGYAVGGIAGMISTLYDKDENSGDDSQTDTDAKDVVTNCFVNLSSITTPELPDGHQKSVHRIAGFTSINNLEPDWENITDPDNIDKFLPTEPELGLKNNYAIASLAKVDEGIESAATTTEGCDVEASELSNQFFAGLGYKFGEADDAPWRDTPEDDPSLYFEFGSKFMLDEVVAKVNDSFSVELLVISRQPMTADMFIDGFAGEIAHEDIAEMNGEFGFNRNVATIGFNALKEGDTEFTANVNGSLAKIKIRVTSGQSGIEDIISPEESLAIIIEGTTISAHDSLLEVYSLDGRKVAGGRGSVSVASLPSGVYVVSARDSLGNKATAKFFLQ